MEIVSNKGVIADASTPAGRAGMSESEWREAIKFDSTDTGWVIMSIGMAIGAGIVFLPVQVGLMGLWVFLLSSVIGYPAMYLFQRLFINTLAESPECKDYPSVISGYLGKNWGILLGALYFVMLVIWMFVYSTAITNDSASLPAYLRRDGRVAVRQSLLWSGTDLHSGGDLLTRREIVIQNFDGDGADQAAGGRGAGRVDGGNVASV